MGAIERTGLLLINLGTPASSRPADVRRYLREFLSDPRVLDMPTWKRRLVLELFILPFRPKQSGEAYEKVWTDRGSPLLWLSEDLTEKVRKLLGDAGDVELAMRYGNPSIASALAARRATHRDCDRHQDALLRGVPLLRPCFVGLVTTKQTECLPYTVQSSPINTHGAQSATRCIRLNYPANDSSDLEGNWKQTQ